MPRPRTSSRSNRRSERGVAMLIALISIAILTAVGADFAYNSRVDLQLAANQRDEVRAYYLARSGIGMARLMLRFQKQLDSIQMPNISGLLSQLTGSAKGSADPLAALAGAAGAAGAGAAAPASNLNIQLWKMARIDCHMLKGMVKSDGVDEKSAPKETNQKFEFDEENPEEAARQAQRSFGGFEGCFLATISDEEEKLNLNKLDAPALSSQVVVARLIDMLGDKRFEFLFDHEDSNGQKVAPADVVLALKDWIDEDEGQSQLNLSGQGEPFVRGFSDENYQYDRYSPRYKAKNGKFDSLDELYLVHGVNDRFMAAFRDRFTVYPDMNARLNINSDDPMLLYMAILSVADPVRPDPRLKDPLFVEQLIQKIRAARMFAMLSMSITDFVNVVQSAGVPINTTILNNPANNRAIGDKSTTFTIKSVGEAGAVQKTITAVVRLDDGLGRLVHWREE